MGRMKKRGSQFLIGLAVFLATAFVTVLALNFSDRQAPVELQLPHLYGARDQQFTRSMGGLLDPSIVAGNKVSELLNGDQIFPSMLGASKQLKTPSISRPIFIGRVI